MNAVYLTAWQSCSIAEPLPPSLLNLPLFRRMTPLQKSVLLAFARLLEAHPDLLAMSPEAPPPIYFTSTFGEIGSMLRVTQAIDLKQLPVSPKDFQHSVLNASLAYLSMAYQWHQSTFALSGGYAAADATLYLAAHRLAGGIDSSSFLVHAAEWEEDQAQAEILFLNARPGPGPSYALEQIEYQSMHAAQGSHEALPHHFNEAQETHQIPWLIEKGTPLLGRRLETRQGQLLITRWKAL